MDGGVGWGLGGEGEAGVVSDGEGVEERGRDGIGP